MWLQQKPKALTYQHYMRLASLEYAALEVRCPQWQWQWPRKSTKWIIIWGMSASLRIEGGQPGLNQCRSMGKNLLPHHQHVCQISMEHQSYSPIVMEWSYHPCLPSTCHFQSSATQPSHHKDEFLALLIVLKVLLITLASRAMMINGSLIMIMAPLIQFHFLCLCHLAILLGDISNEWAAIALVPISLLCCFSSALCCPNLISFPACTAVLIRFSPMIEPVIFILSCCSVI